MVDTGVFCTGTEVLYKAGAGVSSVSSAEAYTNAYMVQSEGYINARCKYDFTTGYAGLSAMCKAVLKRWSSALAAIDVINYDPNGIASTVKYQTRLNVLKDEASDCENFMTNINLRDFAIAGA